MVAVVGSTAGLAGTKHIFLIATEIDSVRSRIVVVLINVIVHHNES